MAEFELVKMSAKGQLVVPEDVRKTADFQAGDRFVPIAIEDGVVFKRIRMPDISKELSKLSEKIEAKFKKLKLGPKTANEAVEWAKKSS